MRAPGPARGRRISSVDRGCSKLLVLQLHLEWARDPQ